MKGSEPTMPVNGAETLADSKTTQPPVGDGRNARAAADSKAPPLSKRVVIAVKEPTEVFVEALVIREMRSQHKGLEKPRRTSLMPFHRLASGHDCTI
jgi:hypothetical protein